MRTAKEIQTLVLHITTELNNLLDIDHGLIIMLDNQASAAEKSRTDIAAARHARAELAKRIAEYRKMVRSPNYVSHLITTAPVPKTMPTQHVPTVPTPRPVGTKPPLRSPATQAAYEAMDEAGTALELYKSETAGYYPEEEARLQRLFDVADAEYIRCRDIDEANTLEYARNNP